MRSAADFTVAVQCFSIGNSALRIPNSTFGLRSVDDNEQFGLVFADVLQVVADTGIEV